MATELEIKQEKKIAELEIELIRTKQIIVICANCHDIRDEQDIWHPVADFLSRKFKINFSHSICPECTKKLYPDFYKG